MERSILVIALALVTLALVMFWAWYTKRDALSGLDGPAFAPDPRHDSGHGSRAVQASPVSSDQSGQPDGARPKASASEKDTGE